MSRDWMPGDVVLLDSGTPAERIGLRDHRNEGWRTSWGYMSDETTAKGAVIRPLVVIDPEDREQVERLLEGYANWSPGELAEFPKYVDDMQTALRRVIAPKPPEPTGLGAVVEDADGKLWTRYDSRDPQPWWRAGTGDPNEPIECRFSYGDLAAVRVLTEGVTA